MSVWADFVAGSLSGAASMFVEYPFDTVKVLLQVYGGSHTSTATMPHASARTAAVTTALQSSSSSSRQVTQHCHYTGYVDCFVKTYKQSGICGFYRGVAARMCASAFDHACVFVSYKYTLRRIGADVERPTAAQVCLGGCGSGVASTLCLTPFELVKCCMQADDCPRAMSRAHTTATRTTTTAAAGRCHASSSAASADAAVMLRGRRYRSSWHCFCTLYREGGVAGLYRGGTAMLLREVPGTAAWCGTYDLLKVAMSTPAHEKAGNTHTSNTNTSSQRCDVRDEDEAAVRRATSSSPPTLPLWKRMLAGGCSGVAFWTVLFPADVIKTRMQVDAHFARLSLTQALVLQYRESGVRGLYRGWALTALRSFPSNAILFTVFDLCSQYMTPPRPPPSSSSRDSDLRAGIPT